MIESEPKEMRPMTAELLAQNKLFKKTLGKFMNLFIHPIESNFQKREFNIKLKKYIRELNR